MNVGVYFDLRNPASSGLSTAALYGATLELCEEADQLGCHSLWLSEHHRFDDGYLPQPLTFAAAVAARTRRARIGTAIAIAPLHPPADIAEQATIVDLLSSGRLDLGLGAGYRVPEFELFGAELARRYTATDDCVRALRRFWAEGVTTPAPAQRRVPIWMGYAGPQGARRAGRLGEGLLTAHPDSWPHYRDGLIEGRHDLATGRMTGGVQAWITDDPERDWPVVRRHLAAQVDSYRRHMVEGTDQPLPRAVDPDRLRDREINPTPLSYFIFGTPDEVAARLRSALVDAPIETVFLWASIGGMPLDLAARHVRAVCTELAPRLADHLPAPTHDRRRPASERQEKPAGST
jgi:alkanesulfonate monooxygenase SsuD/methylene tetrahydromethanopterin reductase-like flavin-dependent oxidoreductase (luciferase family)